MVQELDVCEKEKANIMVESARDLSTKKSLLFVKSAFLEIGLISVNILPRQTCVQPHPNYSPYNNELYLHCLYAIHT